MSHATAAGSPSAEAGSVSSKSNLLTLSDLPGGPAPSLPPASKNQEEATDGLHFNGSHCNACLVRASLDLN